MSRVGKKPVKIPANVQINIVDGDIKVTGPKGELKTPLLNGIKVQISDQLLEVSRESEDPRIRAAHGLTRALVQNMIIGVTDGFSKELEVNGVGFKVQLSGSDLRMSLGFSHEVIFKVPADVHVKVDANRIIVTGIDKQRVGQVAAEIRECKKPEPYKGKGIKYIDERSIRKAGKSGKEK